MSEEEQKAEWVRIGNRIRTARKQYPGGVKRLAQNLKVSRKSIEYWEKGERNPHHKLPAIAQELGYPVEWFKGPSTEERLEAVERELREERDQRLLLAAAMSGLLRELGELRGGGHDPASGDQGR